MFVYSRKIVRFIEAIKKGIKDILSRELGLKVTKERFFDKFGFNSYPINVVIFNNRNLWGFFDSEFYEFGFHECLMFANQEKLYNVIRHELAHCLIFNTYGPSVQSHGLEFKAFCQKQGWGSEIFSATAPCLENSDSQEASNILRKVQKLMALATSSNQNEAEQAMIKSQQLLLKHHLDTNNASYQDDSDEKIFLKRILKQKKRNAKMLSISHILKTFFVSTVYASYDGFVNLEIVGSSVNLEIAEYVANVLQRELDRLWEQAKSQYINLKGLAAKNSFFLGVAKGYCNKIEALKKSYAQEATKAVIAIEKKLVNAEALIYNRLTKSRSQGRYCPGSSAIGEQVGRQLSINSAIQKTPRNSGLMLP